MGNSVATIPLPDRQSPNIVEAFPNDGSTSFKFSLEGRTVYALRGIEASRLFHDPASPVSTLGAFPSHLDAFYGMGTFPSVRSVLLMEGTQHHTAKAELLLAVASEKVAAHCAGVASVLDQTWADWKGTSGKLQERCKQIALRASARCVLGITAETKLRQLDAIASGFSLFDLVGDAAVASSVRDALVGIVDQQTEIESSPDTVEGGGLDDAVLDILMHAADSMNCETVAIVTVHMFVLLWEALARVLVSIVKQLEQHPDIREELRKEAQDAHKANPGCTAANSVLVGSTKQLSFFVKEIKRTTQIAPLPFRRMTDQVSRQLVLSVRCYFLRESDC
eukprot:TRINITY_DN515_c0_g1_i1.p1 TRINITY_DN515_c0_g1~~TRINITY_DN515_c0_g1_i1.p1  ORF type:complete len:336 (-),score=67.33 TRINITY_DN515_c0_g1_i1:541-1548(-)